MTDTNQSSLDSVLNQLKLDGVDNLVKKAYQARIDYGNKLEQAEKDRDSDKAHYLQGVIDGLNVLLGPLE